MKSKTSKCGTCGYEWPTGQDGSHTCSVYLLATINKLKQERGDIAKLIELPNGESVDPSIVKAIRKYLQGPDPTSMPRVCIQLDANYGNIRLPCETNEECAELAIKILKLLTQ